MNMRQNDLCCGHGGVVWRKAAEAEGVEYIVWEWDRLHTPEKGMHAAAMEHARRRDRGAARFRHSGADRASVRGRRPAAF